MSLKDEQMAHLKVNSRCSYAARFLMPRGDTTHCHWDLRFARRISAREAMIISNLFTQTPIISSAGGSLWTLCRGWLGVVGARYDGNERSCYGWLGGQLHYSFDAANGFNVSTGSYCASEQERHGSSESHCAHTRGGGRLPSTHIAQCAHSCTQRQNTLNGFQGFSPLGMLLLACSAGKHLLTALTAAFHLRNAING